jgi:hypothetical protein
MWLRIVVLDHVLNNLSCRQSLMGNWPRCGTTRGNWSDSEGFEKLGPTLPRRDNYLCRLAVGQETPEEVSEFAPYLRPGKFSVLCFFDNDLLELRVLDRVDGLDELFEIAQNFIFELVGGQNERRCRGSGAAYTYSSHLGMRPHLS